MYFILCSVLPKASSAQTIVSDFGLVALELSALVLCVLAMRKTTEKRGKWIWALVIGWVALNAIADGIWGGHELKGAAVASPNLSDWFHLPSYGLAFAAVVLAAWKSAGRLRTVESVLDAMMFTIGAAALSWPLIFGRMLTTGVTNAAAFWVNLAYPVADLLILFAFASFFLGAREADERPRPYYVMLCVGFLVQMVADAAYLTITLANGAHQTGNRLNPVWMAAFALAGAAALMETENASATEAEAPVRHERSLPTEQGLGSIPWRLLIPYFGMPVVAIMLLASLLGGMWKWATDTRVLAYLGFSLVLLLLIRQYVTLAQNRRLNADFRKTSWELEEKVEDLADLNARLEVMTTRSHQLNSLREVRAVADAGLELACTFAKAPGGWITLKDDQGPQRLIATRGPVSSHRPGDAKFSVVEVAKGSVAAVPLEARGEELGTLWLSHPEGKGRGPDLLPIVAAHISTAIDNTRRYEEAIDLAERDPLTGLFNHRGIHKRLAGESMRAQQNHSELSVIMLDMDNFKLLNDTYGHPVGDAVLRHVSDAIRSILRHADLAGRVGGDELLVVLPNTGHEGAIQLSERLKEQLDATPFVTEDGAEIQVRLSFGVASFPENAQSLAQLVETADANLYVSKQQGGNTVTGGPGSGDGGHLDPQDILGVAGKLLDVVGARDHYTRRHSEMVTLYAISLGEVMGLSEESLDTLHIAAMLHDIGKIGVSAELLRRPASLTAAEQDMVHRHVDLGVSVIKDMPRLAQVAEAVNAHHEHVDGSGYPSETAGDDIPLLGRILAVADAYSAMTLDRPYRKGLSREQARAEMMKVAGTQLDPELVQRFFRLIDRNGDHPRGTQVKAG